MTIYHFGRTLEGIREAFKDAPALRSYVNHPELRAAYKQFTSDFPSFIALRHAISHSAELIATLDDFRSSSAKGEDLQVPGISIQGSGHVHISDMLAGDVFTASLDGQAYSYSLSEESLNKLLHTAIRFGWAFNQIAVQLKEPAADRTTIQKRPIPRPCDYVRSSYSSGKLARPERFERPTLRFVV